MGRQPVGGVLNRIELVSPRLIGHNKTASYVEF